MSFEHNHNLPRLTTDRSKHQSVARSSPKFVTSLLLFGAFAASPLLSACHSAPKSTRLTVGDMKEISEAMASDLRQSELMQSRSEMSERIWIAMDKVENLSSDLIPRREQWYMMARLQASAALINLSNEKNFAMVVPAEQAFGVEGQQSRREGPGVYQKRKATHELTGTIRSATRSDGKARTDVYLTDFRLTSLATGEMLWTGTYEIKRVASGLSFD